MYEPGKNFTATFQQSSVSSGSRPDHIRDTKSPELNYRDREFNYRVVSVTDRDFQSPYRPLEPVVLKKIRRRFAPPKGAELQLPRGVTDAEILAVQLL